MGAGCGRSPKVAKFSMLAMLATLAPSRYETGIGERLAWPP